MTRSTAKQGKIKVKMALGSPGGGGGDSVICPKCESCIGFVPGKALEVWYADHKMCVGAIKHNQVKYKIFGERANLQHPGEAQVAAFDIPKRERIFYLNRLTDEELPNAIEQARAYINGI